MPRLNTPLGIFLGSCVLMACRPVPAANETGSTKQALEVVVTGHPARKNLVLRTSQPARMEALEATPIHAKVAAYVEAVLVDIGDRVKQGQPLVKLRAPEIDADVAQKLASRELARAEWSQAQANVVAAQAKVKATKSLVAQAEAGLSRAQADIQRWTSEFQRLSELQKSGAVNRQVVDEAAQKLSAAQAAGLEVQAAVDTAQTQVAQAEADLQSSSAGVATAQARIEVANANIAHAEAMKSYLTLTAPYDGTVSDRRVDTGHFVLPVAGTATPLMNIVRDDALRVSIAVPEAEAPYVDLGDEVSIDFPAIKGGAISGKVSRTAGVIDTAHRSLTTIVDIPNSEHRFRPGLYATATIVLHEQPSALTLPSAAVVRTPQEAYCFRFVQGKAVKTLVQVGLKIADEFEITSGIAETDLVILNKAIQLKDDQSVASQPK